MGGLVTNFAVGPRKFKFYLWTQSQIKNRWNDYKNETTYCKWRTQKLSKLHYSPLLDLILCASEGVLLDCLVSCVKLLRTCKLFSLIISQKNLCSQIVSFRQILSPLFITLTNKFLESTNYFFNYKAMSEKTLQNSSKWFQQYSFPPTLGPAITFSEQLKRTQLKSFVNVWTWWCHLAPVQHSAALLAMGKCFSDEGGPQFNMMKWLLNFSIFFGFKIYAEGTLRVRKLPVNKLKYIIVFCLASTMDVTVMSENYFQFERHLKWV